MRLVLPALLGLASFVDASSNDPSVSEFAAPRAITEAIGRQKRKSAENKNIQAREDKLKTLATQGWLEGWSKVYDGPIMVLWLADLEDIQREIKSNGPGYLDGIARRMEALAASGKVANSFGVSGADKYGDFLLFQSTPFIDVMKQALNKISSNQRWGMLYAPDGPYTVMAYAKYVQMIGFDPTVKRTRRSDYYYNILPNGVMLKSLGRDYLSEKKYACDSKTQFVNPREFDTKGKGFDSGYLYDQKEVEKYSNVCRESGFFSSIKYPSLDELAKLERLHR